MNYLQRLVLATGLVIFLSSFSTAMAQDSSNLELSNPSLKWQRSVRFNPRITASTSGNDAEDYPTGTSRPTSSMRNTVSYFDNYGEAKVTVRNTSAKTIKKIAWEYSLFSDAGRSQLLKSYTVYSKRKIRAGETKVLRDRVWASVGPSSQYQRVRPLRIEYADGTVWVAP